MSLENKSDDDAVDRFHSAAKESSINYVTSVIVYPESDALTDANARLTDTVSVVYRGSALVAQYTNQYLKDKSAKIIDICAGTGAGAEELRKYGFSSVDALDGAAEMLEVARRKQLYHDYFCEYLHPGQQTKLPADCYDAVICIGSFLGGHLKPEVADEFLRILKPGGYCIIGTREQWLEVVPEYKGSSSKYVTRLVKLFSGHVRGRRPRIRR